MIEPWLEETALYADEILIALHAPTDGTDSIVADFARHSPIRVVVREFPADTVARYGFSLMKNELIAVARGDWLTSFDADEGIAVDRSELESVLGLAEQSGRSLISLRLAAPHEERRTPPENWKIVGRRSYASQHAPVHPPVRKQRVFRNHSGYWWRGLIHEVLYRDHRSPHADCLDTDILLHHYSYLKGPPTEEKGGLYSYLVCRIYDHPHLRDTTNRWWFADGFVPNEQAIRDTAAQFIKRHREWELFRQHSES